MVDADGTTSPRLPSHCVQAALLSAHSPEGASSSPRRGHVTARRRAPGGRGFAASRGTTSRYLDDDDDDDDDLDDRCEVERRRARPVRLAAAGCRAAAARPSLPGALESRPGGCESQRRRTRARTRTRRRGVGGCLVTAAAARSLEGYQSDAPANCSADANVRCSGYSSVLPVCHTVTTAVCSARRAVTNVGKSTSLTNISRKSEPCCPGRASISTKCLVLYPRKLPKIRTNHSVCTVIGLQNTQWTGSIRKSTCLASNLCRALGSASRGSVCSGYSSDSVDPATTTSRARRRLTVSTAAQTNAGDDVIAGGGGTGNDVTGGGSKTGIGRRMRVHACRDDRI